MKAVVATIGVIVIGIVLIGLWVGGVNNRLVTLDQEVRSSWSQVENTYQRRLDLVPNLVETVKGAAQFEKETFTEVAEARSRAGQLLVDGRLLDDPERMAQLEAAQQRLSSGLSRLIATAEAYPALRASENFRDLQAQLEGTENRIAVERRRFNQAVAAYNTRVLQFPTRIAASMLGFDQRPYFQAQPGAQEAPKVRF